MTDGGSRSFSRSLREGENEADGVISCPKVPECTKEVHEDTFGLEIALDAHYTPSYATRICTWQTGSQYDLDNPHGTSPRNQRPLPSWK